MTRSLFLTAFAATALLAACSKSASPEATSAANAPPPPKPVDPGSPTVNDWQGSWDAPDGSFIKITRLDQGYEVIVKNSSGAQAFRGDDHEDLLQFERNNTMETVRPVDGKGTGVPGLETRQNCLVIRPGEGFCRGA